MTDMHFGFILAAFMVAAVILTALSLWIAIDYRRVTKAIAALEHSGATRRAETKTS